VSQALIVVNVVLFLGQTLTGGGGFRARSGAIYEAGFLFGPAVDAGEVWRLITSGFLHADPVHLLLNMAGVYFLGQLIEPAIGAVRYLALYFGSLLMGSFGALLLSPDAATIGASGAVFGLLGAAVIMMRQRGINPMQTFIGPILLINVLFTFRPGISIGGHFGGLLGGILCALIIAAAAERGRRGLQLGVVGCVAVGLAAAIGGVVAAGTPALYG
jgi:membrane associated rhomboid family serine protease